MLTKVKIVDNSGGIDARIIKILNNRLLKHDISKKE